MKTSRLKLFTEIIGIYCKYHTIHTQTHTHILWAPFNLCILNKVVHIVTTPFKVLNFSFTEVKTTGTVVIAYNKIRGTEADKHAIEAHTCCTSSVSNRGINCGSVHAISKTTPPATRRRHLPPIPQLESTN